MPDEITALLANTRLILRETQRAVTPLGGVAVEAGVCCEASYKYSAISKAYSINNVHGPTIGILNNSCEPGNLRSRSYVGVKSITIRSLANEPR
ncbi:MAG: hypothetical protein ACLPYB_07655 [Desulfobaccales bacterium]